MSPPTELLEKLLQVSTDTRKRLAEAGKGLPGWEVARLLNTPELYVEAVCGDERDDIHHNNAWLPADASLIYRTTTGRMIEARERGFIGLQLLAGKAEEARKILVHPRSGPWDAHMATVSLLVMLEGLTHD